MTLRAFHLARFFLKIFLRDRQALFFGLFFPLIFMSVLGYINDRGPGTIRIGVANQASSPLAGQFVKTLAANKMFKVETGDEAALKARLMHGDTTLVLVIPPGFGNTTGVNDIVAFVDASQVRLLSFIRPAMEGELLSIERRLRHTEPMFHLRVKDVEARPQRYIDFLLPGILAFTLMQISIAGSGFNIVEYRRKGILKRLFVTPIKPAEFIAAICLARLVWCLAQLTVLLVVAIALFKVTIAGNLLALYFMVILGTIIFLCIGFSVGSLARTQQGVGAVGNIVIFPQMFLSGVFFPIKMMPAMVQPLARALPLTPVVDSLRGISNDGATLLQIWPSLAGVLIWIGISFVVATRLFSWKEVVR